MKKQSIKILAVTLLTWSAFAAQAQMHHGSMHGSQPSAETVQDHGGHMMGGHKASTSEELAAQVVQGVGVIKKIDENKMRITLEHDPIEALGWPKMVMPFKVADHGLFNGLGVGDQVTFELKDETTIISIKKM